MVPALNMLTPPTPATVLLLRALPALFARLRIPPLSVMLNPVFPALPPRVKFPGPFLMREELLPETLVWITALIVRVAAEFVTLIAPFAEEPNATVIGRLVAALLAPVYSSV